MAAEASIRHFPNAHLFFQRGTVTRGPHSDCIEFLATIGDIATHGWVETF